MSPKDDATDRSLPPARAHERDTHVDATPSPPRTPVVPRVFAGGGIAGLGGVAGAAAWASAGAGLRYGAVSIDAEGRFVLPSSESAGDGRVRTSTIGGALLPCAHVDALFVCAEALVGALQGEAAAIDAPERATTFFAQAGARVGASFGLGSRMTLEPMLDGLFTLTRTRINFRGQEVWSTRPFGLDGGLRVVLHFP